MHSLIWMCGPKLCSMKISAAKQNQDCHPEPTAKDLDSSATPQNDEVIAKGMEDMSTKFKEEGAEIQEGWLIITGCRNYAL